MKHTWIVLMIFCLAPLLLKAQLSLSVEISGLRNNKGQVHFELVDEHERSVLGVSKNISGNKCVIVLENLKPGKYAFKFFHDENSNKELDTNWLSIPKEGFGFSNNPAMTFGPPAFSKTIFELSQSSEMKCKPKYF